MDGAMTVDCKARRAAAQLFRNFISGRITNDEFEGRRPATGDRAIHAIWDTAWCLYSDTHEHRLVGNYRLTYDIKRSCVRWLLFLHGNLDYCWPDIRLPGIDPTPRIRDGFHLWLRTPKSSALRRDEAEHFLETGNYAVWPFVSVKDDKLALRNPKLLSGTGSL
jgi:hypothetical protein